MEAAGAKWHEHGYVFASRTDTRLDAANVRRAFRQVVAAAGVDARQWTPRELRHSFVSLLSDAGVPLENISRLVGHSDTTVTETVYRHQLRPILLQGAERRWTPSFRRTTTNLSHAVNVSHLRPGE
jgi:integrase